MKNDMKNRKAGEKQNMRYDEPNRNAQNRNREEEKVHNYQRRRNGHCKGGITDAWNAGQKKCSSRNVAQFFKNGDMEPHRKNRQEITDMEEMGKDMGDG